jgi:hypothetical protein
VDQHDVLHVRTCVHGIASSARDSSPGSIWI